MTPVRATAPVSRRPRGEAGVAGVLVLALAGVLSLVGAVSASLAAVAVARQRAAAVADLAALAAAGAALQGEPAACARAGRLAAANSAALVWCRLDGEVAVVVAQVRPPGPLGGLGTASARARAGPTGADPVGGNAAPLLLVEPPDSTATVRAPLSTGRNLSLPESLPVVPGARPTARAARAPPTSGVLPHAAVLHRTAAAGTLPLVRRAAR